MSSPAVEDDDPLPVSITWVEVVLISIIFAIMSGGTFGRGIGDVSCTYHLNYSPATEAFGIWGVIYFLAFTTVFAQWASYMRPHHMFATPEANLLFASAWLFATLWTPAFVSNKKWTHIVAAILLCACASCALGASVVENAWQHDVDERRRWYIGVPFSMLAGWTLTAAAVSVGIAYEANDNTPDDDCKSERSGYSMFNTHINVQDYSYAPLVLSLVVFVVAVWLPDPILPIPVLWGIFYMVPSYPNWMGFVLLCVASLFAFGRAYLF